MSKKEMLYHGILIISIFICFIFYTKDLLQDNNNKKQQQQQQHVTIVKTNFQYFGTE